MERVEIYTLSHPLTKEVRYIGKANDSKKRLMKHLSDSKRRNTPVYCWIRKLCSSGLIPNIEVIEIINSENWMDAEIKHISEYKNKGYRLLNVASGGDEPFCSKEIRAENGKKVAEAIHSDPWLKTT
jgi:protein-tyrosine phosphatase